MQTAVKAKTMPGFRLRVTFADGFTGEVELKNHIQKSDWPVVQPLKDPGFFRRVRVKNGSVAWPVERVPASSAVSVSYTGPTAMPLMMMSTR